MRNDGNPLLGQERPRLSISLVNSYPHSLVSFRASLIKVLVQRGIITWVLSPGLTSDIEKKVLELGGIPKEYPLDRTGLSLLRDVRTLVFLISFFSRERPDIVLTWQAKPNVYGIIAAAIAGVPTRASVVEGLGYFFIPGEESLKKRLLRTTMKALFRLSFGLADKVFFLNPDDLEEFLNLELVSRTKAVLLGGIGVPLEDWPPAPPHLSPRPLPSSRGSSGRRAYGSLLRQPGE